MATWGIMTEHSLLSSLCVFVFTYAAMDVKVQITKHLKKTLKKISGQW